MIYISGLPLSFQYFLQTSIKTKKKLRRGGHFWICEFFFHYSRRQIFALSSDCCRNFKWLLRGEVVYTDTTIAIANAHRSQNRLNVRTYHLHFSRQLFVQRIEYIALLLRRSPANSCRYDIIAMNYSKPVATKT